MPIQFEYVPKKQLLSLEWWKSVSEYFYLRLI